MNATLDQLDALARKLIDRASVQLDGPVTVEDTTRLLAQVAELSKSLRPRRLMAVDFSEFVNQSIDAYTLQGVEGEVSLLVVNGAIVPKNKWSWDAEGHNLILLSYSIPAGATAEVYVAPV